MEEYRRLLTNEPNDIAETVRDIVRKRKDDTNSFIDYKHFTNTVIVKSQDDLIGIDSTKNYMLDGFIDITTPIIIPIGGISISGLNGARDTCGLRTSGNNVTIFSTASGSYSGNVVLESCTIEASGTGCKVFDLDNDGNSNAIDIVGVNFVDCTSLGSLTDYRQLLIDTAGFIGISDGLTFNGTWSGVAILSSIAISFPAATLLKAGTGFTIGNVRSDINFLSVNSSAVLCDFSASNITTKGGLSLTNVRTTATNPLPNISGSSVYARFRNCQGFRNTYVGARYVISSETATTISGTSVPVKIAGTTTYSDEQWFTHTTNNAFVYDGNQTIDVSIQGHLSISGTNGDVANVYVRQWDDSASSYIDLSETGGDTMNSAGKVEGIVFFGYGRLDNNDRIEIWVENETAARNFTAKLNGIVSVTERAN